MTKEEQIKIKTEEVNNITHKTSGTADLKKAEKNISNISTYEVGDILVNKYGCERMVLAVVGKLVFYSAWNDFDSAGAYQTVEQLEKNSYTFKQDQEEIKEMTVSQISELVGQKVKIIEG